MDEESLRARAARAKRKMSGKEPVDVPAGQPQPTVKVSGLRFALNDDQRRKVEQDRIEVRNILGRKDIDV